MQNNFVCQKAVAFMRQLFLPPHACFPSGRAHPLPLQAAAFGFSGRFGISVLSGFPDDHPLWQENFSKLALQSHVRPETLPAKALSKDCYRYPKRCSRDELRSVHRSSAARLLRAAEIKHPCSRFAGTCM